MEKQNVNIREYLIKRERCDADGSSKIKPTGSVKQQRRRRQKNKTHNKLNKPDNAKHENIVKREVLALLT